jgi:hypothetical protein
MRFQSPWQVLSGYITVLVLIYIIATIIASVTAILDLKYLTLGILAILLIVFVLAIPAMLNFARSNYLILFSWFVIHNFISTIVVAFLYAKSGVYVTTSGKLDTSFHAGMSLSLNIWTTLGFADLIPVPHMRLFASLQAFLALFTIPVGFSLLWLLVTESLVPPQKAYLDKLKFRFSKNGDIVGKKEDG